MPDRSAAIAYRPLELRHGDIGPFRLTAAWTLAGGDVRLAGLSALAVRGNELVALTDSGVVIALPKPAVAQHLARFHDLPNGPGWPTFKRYRDSEALVWDPARRIWWVAFENRHSLWFYDPEFTRGAMQLPLGDRGWRVNKGVEGMVLHGGDNPLLFPETGDFVLTVSDSGQTIGRLHGAEGEIADAVRLPDGRTLVVQRQLSIAGIRNRLAWLSREERGYQLHQIGVLPLGPFDNVEGLAAEPLTDGKTRIWAVTDNDGWRRTVLLALDLPPTAESRPRPGRGGSKSPLQEGRSAAPAGR